MLKEEVHGVCDHPSSSTYHQSPVNEGMSEMGLQAVCKIGHELTRTADWALSFSR